MEEYCIVIYIPVNQSQTVKKYFTEAEFVNVKFRSGFWAYSRAEIRTFACHTAGQRTTPPTELRCTLHPKEMQKENIGSVKTGFLLRTDR